MQVERLVKWWGGGSDVISVDNHGIIMACRGHNVSHKPNAYPPGLISR